VAKEDGNVSDIAILLLRAGVGGMLCIYHGWGKLVGAWLWAFRSTDWGFAQFVGSLGFPVPVFFAICAALAESVFAVLLAIGLRTREAAAIVAFNMAVAVYHHARSDGKVESALLYLLPALLFVFAPAGRFSLDALLRGRTPAKRK
jgi:putative oxidoreductase